LALSVKGEVKSKDVYNWLSLSSVKSFSRNRLYKGFSFKVEKLVILIAQTVLIKAKPFALESTKAVRGTLYLFFNIIYNIIKCLPFISQLRSIFDRLIAYLR